MFPSVLEQDKVMLQQSVGDVNACLGTRIWNDQKSFGFISPSEGRGRAAAPLQPGGEDIFVHRTAVAEGLTLSPGMAVSFVPQWDDKKNKAVEE